MDAWVNNQNPCLKSLAQKGLYNIVIYIATEYDFTNILTISLWSLVTLNLFVIHPGIHRYPLGHCVSKGFEA